MSPTIQESGGEAAATNGGLPADAFINQTGVAVEKNTNEVSVTYKRTSGFPGDRFRIFAPENDAGRTCKQVYSDDDAEVGTEFVTHHATSVDPDPDDDGHEIVTRIINVIEANLTRALDMLWFRKNDQEEDDSEGSVEMCLVSELMSSASGGVALGWVVSKLQLFVDLTNSTWTLFADAETSEVSDSTADLKNIYAVDAYVCPGTGGGEGGADEYGNVTAQEIKQNSRFSLCMVPSSKSVLIKELFIDSASNGAGDSLDSYLGMSSDPVPFTPKNSLIEAVKKTADDGAFTSDGRKAVELRFFTLAKMFEGEDPSLTLSGRAVLAFFANPNGGDDERRLMKEGGSVQEVSFRLRGLQEQTDGGDAGTAALRVQVALAPRETNLVDENVHHESHDQEGAGASDAAFKTDSAGFVAYEEKKALISLGLAILLGAGAALF